MNKLVYNICMGMGLVLFMAGSVIVWGVGVALIVCGLLVVALTALTAWVGG